MMKAVAIGDWRLAAGLGWAGLGQEYINLAGL